MSVSHLTALLLAGAPVSADLPPVPADLQATQVQAFPAEAEAVAPTEQPDTAGDENQHEIIVSGSIGAPPGDPLVELNAQSYDAIQAVDQAIVGPLAKGYEDIVPKPIRSGLRNFLRNLKAPIIALNFLLQLKPGKAAETLGRFAINSTVGLGGLIDVAKDDPFNLPFRPNGFADTLGYYGVGPGPYFFLPLIGPTTLRDLLGGGVDGLILPTFVGAPFNRLEYSLPAGAAGALDYRVEFGDRITGQQQAEDPYTAAKEFYLKQRQAQIDGLRGIKVDTPAFTGPARTEPTASAEVPTAELEPQD